MKLETRVGTGGGEKRPPGGNPGEFIAIVVFFFLRLYVYGASGYETDCHSLDRLNTINDFLK